MKHLNYLFSLALIVLGFSWASADVVSPYSVDFNTTISTSAKDFKVAPGWKHIPSTSYWGMTYSYNSASGVDGTGALYCQSQTTSSLDYLVTPALTGNMTLAVKLARSSSYIKFYAVSEDLVVSETPLLEQAYVAADAENYVTLTVSGLNNQRVAILANYAYIDNFAAEQADVVLQPALTITREGYTNYVYPNCDANNDFSVTYDFKITVTNTGERDLAVNEEGYSISIAQKDFPETPVATFNIPVALAVGESYDFTDGITFTDNYSSYGTNTRIRYDIYENIGGTFVTGNWIQPRPYLPGMTVKEGTNDLSEAAKATAFGSFGMINQNTTKTITVSSTGAAPLAGTITLTADGCFSVDQTQINLASGETLNVNVTADVTTPGVFSGSLLFAGDGVDSVTIPLSATVLDNAKFFEPFTDNASSTTEPLGWYDMDNEWEKTSKTNGDNNYMKALLGAYHKLVTPLLKVVEGEKMSFEAARQTNSYASEYGVKVYYSTDRQNWTLVKEVFATELPSAPTSYTSAPNFATIVVEGVPAGEYYIAFESGYCAIDNVYGFELVPVNHDVVVEKFDIPAKASVNNDVKATVTLRNLLAADESEYTATLFFNNEDVATASPVIIPAGGTANVEFAFVPNQMGTFPVYAQFEWGESYNVSTEIADIEITEELLEGLVQVGEYLATDKTAPVNAYYKNSESEALYTAEQIGLDAGTKITSINYKGYYSGSKELVRNTTFWIANVETTDMVNTGASVLFNTEGMTQVFSGDVLFTQGGTATNHEVVLSVELDEPFVYTGGNLRIIARSTADDYINNFNFELDNTNRTQCLVRVTDNAGAWTSGATTATNYLPVVYLGIEKEPVMFTGVVTDTNGDPIEGVNVILTSQVPEGAPARAATAGSAVYTAVTDADGAFAVEVKQPNIYDATFAKDGYKPVTMESIDLTNGNVELTDDVVMEKDSSTGVANISGKAIKSVKFYNVAGQAADKAFQGVNIVVTTYTDGTTSTAKVVK